MSPTATRTPTEEGTFDFGEAIRLEMAANPTATRNQLAAIVARQIPRRDHVRVIEALLLYVIDEQRNLHRTAPRPIQPATPEPSHGRPARHIMTRPPVAPQAEPAPGYAPAWTTPTPAPADEPETVGRRPYVKPRSGPVTTRHEPLPVPKPAAPSRWPGIAVTYRKWLDTVVTVDGTMKRRRFLTRDDLRHLIDNLHADAARETRLLEAMRRKRVATVGDLPEPVVAEIMQWQ